MRLGHCDQSRRKDVLCESTGAHSEDRMHFPFDRIPKHVFLEINVINC